MVLTFDDFDSIIGFTDGEAGAFPASFASPIDGHQEVMASAFYIQGDFPIVVDDNRTDVKAVWCYRSDGDGIAVRYNNRTTDAQ